MPKLEGGCFCGALRYQAGDEPLVISQCYCRDCQLHSGGHPNIAVIVKRAHFSYTKGAPKQFVHPESETKVARHFCGECGTHILTASPSYSEIISVKVGTLDDNSLIQATDMLVYVKDRQNFHHLPSGVVQFDELP